MKWVDELIKANGLYLYKLGKFSKPDMIA